MRSTRQTMAWLILALFGLVLLTGCSLDDTPVGDGSACARSKLLNQRSDAAGIYVSPEVQNAARYHCHEHAKADDDVLPNRLYPDNVDDSPCHVIIADPAQNTANEAQEAQCISAWTDRTLYLLKGPSECIKPSNLYTTGHADSAEYKSLQASCDQARQTARDKDQARKGRIFEPLDDVVMVIIIIVLFLFAGGALAAGYSQS